VVSPSRHYDFLRLNADADSTEHSDFTKPKAMNSRHLSCDGCVWRVTLTKILPLHDASPGEFYIMSKRKLYFWQAVDDSTEGFRTTYLLTHITFTTKPLFNEAFGATLALPIDITSKTSQWFACFKSVEGKGHASTACSQNCSATSFSRRLP
jgi:hypothetical protein